jgi:ABC-type sugar transport system substrate-binding protein
MDGIIVIGTDGGAPALDAVAAKTLDMTIGLCGCATGRTGAQLLIDDLRNGTKPKDRFVPVNALVITSDNLDDAKAKIASGEC